MSNGGGKMQQKSLGDILVQMGIISEEDARAVLEHPEVDDDDVASALVADRLIAELPLAEAICTHLSLPFVHVDQYYLDPETVATVPEQLQRAHRFVVVDQFKGIVVLATAGVLSHEIVAEVEKLTECQVQICVTTVSEIRAVLETLGTASAKKTKGSAEEVASAPSPESDADAQSEAALQEVLGTDTDGPPDDLLDPNLISASSDEPEGTPPSMTQTEEEALLEDDEVSQEADELFADLQRDLERFGPVGRDGEDEEA